MNIKFLILVLFSICLLILTYVFFRKHKENVFIDSDKVLSEFKGFKVARDAYEIRSEGFNKEFNSRKKICDSIYGLYNSKKNSLSKKQIEVEEKRIELLKLNLKTFKVNIQERNSKEQKKILDGVYNKVNASISRYAKSKGVMLIISSDYQGKVVYADKEIDVTEEVISFINKEYDEGI